ncbi:MAG: NAD-dependent epimerase/dehydratase family protein [Pelagibacteraceae bacterium]|nr:NAD-dependent epimerase/dehydratase family protein [Pelagibacteraceae bacterium]MCI5078860.1 NAD-dependent epimerase/dehydratase family protein [Pelagibacteraceae bacterium]
MKKIIIVTGGAGFVGSNLIEQLVSRYKYKIISIDNYSSGKKEKHIKSSLVKYVKGDTRDIEKICRTIKKKIKVIFHFGEFSRIHQSFSKIEECFNSNIDGTQKIINFCYENKIKLIYSATSASLGNNGEDKNLSPYSFSKSKNLELIINMHKWFGLSYEILYFFNVYGKRQIETGSMSTVIGIFENLYKKNKPMTVVKPGTQSRKFTHIDDTINGCLLAWKKNKNREYVLSNSKAYRIIDVAKMFSKQIILVPERLGERYKSASVKLVNGRKIFNFLCKKELKDYISNFKKGM